MHSSYFVLFLLVCAFNFYIWVYSEPRYKNFLSGLLVSIFIHYDTHHKIQRINVALSGCLVAVGQATHARHDAEHVVVRRIDVDVRRLLRLILHR